MFVRLQHVHSGDGDLSFAIILSDRKMLMYMQTTLWFP
jgi:hypothetical protein